jgi:transposase
VEVLHPRCAGLDVHKETVVAAIRVVVPGAREPRREVRTFGTTTSALLKLSDWLQENECKQVVMESTGVYWKPVWAVLESAEAFELSLANAAHVKNVPGRKTDVNDATWLADLLAHGLIKASFVPPQHVQHSRELSRTRKQLVRETAQHTLRIQKILETANIKLSSVLSNTLGKTGRAILNAIIDGETSPDVLAQMADPKVKASQHELREALRGHVTEHHRFLLKLELSVIDHLGDAVRDVEARLGQALDPFREDVKRLAAIPGLDTTSAQSVLAEIGTDMSRFPSPEHLVSWATLCPSSDESAGKRRNTRIRKGGAWLKPVLVQAAWCAVRTKKSYLRTKYLRLRARRGTKKAIVAIAASILRTIWHLLTKHSAYKDLGADYLRIDKEKIARRLALRIQSLGYQITLAPAHPS